MRQLTVTVEVCVLEVQQDGTLLELTGDHIPDHLKAVIGDVLELAGRRLLPLAKSSQVSVDLLTDQGFPRPK